MCVRTWWTPCSCARSGALGTPLPPDRERESVCVCMCVCVCVCMHACFNVHPSHIPGEDEGTIVDNLNQQLQEGEPPVPGDQSGKGGGLDDPATRLAVLRKGTMTLLLDNLFLVELSGGMRAICFMQLLLFLSSNLECTKEDCEALVSMLKTLIRQLEFDEEVRTCRKSSFSVDRVTRIGFSLCTCRIGQKITYTHAHTRTRTHTHTHMHVHAYIHTHRM